MRPEIFIIRSEDGADHIFRVVCPVNGISPIYRMPGQAGFRGNPYAYAERVRAWCNVTEYNFSLICANVTSGLLLPYEDPVSGK